MIEVLTSNVQVPLPSNAGSLSIDIRREDLVHPTIGGNKWRKLKYNIEQAKLRGNNTILTFGGAFSNHIAATALAGKEAGFKTIGVIRGEEHLPLNPTLNHAASCGMTFHYLERSKYKEKDSFEVKEELCDALGGHYMIPEGGSNYYGLNGCMEILTKEDQQYTHILCPAGTGCTAAGIAITLKPHQKLLVFPALKGGDFIRKEMIKFIEMIDPDPEFVGEIMDRVEIISDYHFGGYAKTTDELIHFLRAFYQEHKIKWDAIYNGKMTYGVMDLINKGRFNKSDRLLLIHTGGLQGLEGIEQRIGEIIYA